MHQDPSTLPAVLDRLRKQHGTPRRALPKRPLDWVLWENVAYLVEDGRRRTAYLALAQSTDL